jgi:hypothetical protein
MGRAPGGAMVTESRSPTATAPVAAVMNEFQFWCPEGR